MPSNAIYVNTVNTSHTFSNAFNAMYVDAVDGKDIDSTHISVHTFLNIQPIFNPKKVLESSDWGLFSHTIKCYIC